MVPFVDLSQVICNTFLIPLLIFRSKPPVDLLFAGNGGKVTGCSNAHFSRPHNLLLPGRGENMGDGWETARSRAPENSEWVILKFGAPGIINEVIIDTKDFKGNFPQRVDILAIDTPLVSRIGQCHLIEVG